MADALAPVASTAIVKMGMRDALLVSGGVPIPPQDALAYMREAQGGDPRRYYAFLDELKARDAHLESETAKAAEYVTGGIVDIAAHRAIIERFGDDSPEGIMAADIAEAAKIELLSPEARIHDAIHHLVISGLGKGIGGLNVVVEPGAGNEGFEKVIGLIPIPSQRFALGQVLAKQGEEATKWYLQTTDDTSKLVSVESLGASIVLFEPEPEIPSLVRRGFLRRCVQPSVIRVFGIAWWSRAVEAFGMGLRLGYYNEGDAEQKARITAFLRQLGADGMAALPMGTKLEFPTAGNMGSNSHKDLLDWCAGEISKAIHSSTQTTEVDVGAGSVASAAIHDLVTLRRTQARARKVADCLRDQYVRPWVARNFGEVESKLFCPDFVIRVNGGIDRQAIALAALTARQAGMKIPEAWMYDEMDIPRLKDGEKYLGQEEDEKNAEMAAQIAAGNGPQPPQGGPPEMPPKGKQPQEQMPMGAEELAALSANVNDAEGWALRASLEGQRALVDPYQKVINAALRKNLSMSELSASLLREYGTQKKGSAGLAKAMTAILAHAALTGQNAVKRARR